MVHYQLFHPDHEYLGQVLIDFENASGGVSIKPFFEKHGLVNIDPTAWYPAQKFMDVLNDIVSQPGRGMLDFISIGMKQAETAIIPPEYYELPLIDILHGLDAAYRLNNRGTDIGEIRCEQISDKHFKMFFRVPQPDDVWYGVCYGYLRRLVPSHMNFTVYYDENVPRREQGGDVTVIHIEID